MKVYIFYNKHFFLQSLNKEQNSKAIKGIS